MSDHKILVIVIVTDVRVAHEVYTLEKIRHRQPLPPDIAYHSIHQSSLQTLSHPGPSNNIHALDTNFLTPVIAYTSHPSPSSSSSHAEMQRHAWFRRSS
jgi:hypothetical protein